MDNQGIIQGIYPLWEGGVRPHHYRQNEYNVLSGEHSPKFSASGQWNSDKGVLQLVPVDLVQNWTGAQSL